MCGCVKDLYVCVAEMSYEVSMLPASPSMSSHLIPSSLLSVISNQNVKVKCLPYLFVPVAAVNRLHTVSPVFEVASVGL